MRSPLRLSSSSRRELFTALALILLAGCGEGDGIFLPRDGEPAAIAVLRGDDQQGLVGGRLRDPLVVQVTDSRGRPVEGATVAFEFSSAGPGAAVVPQERTTNRDGLADAQLVLGTSIGRQTGQARLVLEEGREPIQASFSAMALPENANSMAAVAGQDQTGHVGLPLADRLVVEVTDGFGNPVAGVSISWAAEGGGSVSEAVVETDEDGRSRVDRILGPIVGLQTTVASSEGLAGSPVHFVHTALAGDASRLVIISGNDQTAEVGSLLPGELVVQLIDPNGNGVPQTAVSWVVATGGGAATPENTTTDGDGRTSARWTLGGVLGPQRLDAVVSGVGVATFLATATAVAPPSLFIRTQPAASARNGVPFTSQPVLQLRDSQGNDVAQAGILVTAAIGSGGGELGGTRQVSTDASGQATFTNLSISGTPGPRTLIFTAPGYAQVTSSEVEVVAIATTTTITADSPDPSAAGSTFPVQVRVTSEGPTPTGTVTVTVSGGTPTCAATLAGGVGSCSLTLNIVGDRTLTATYSGAPGLVGSSDTEPHKVQATEPPPPSATVTTITGDSPDPTISGSTFTVSFQVTSSGGTPTGRVTVTVSGGSPTCTGDLSGGTGSCQLTLNTVGDRTLTATYSGAPGFSASSDTEGHRVNSAPPSNEAPDADYNWDCNGLTCQFTDASDDDDGTVVSWSWNFGGTGTSDVQNPSHTFPGPGEYEVTLTVRDDDGASDVSSAEVDVEAPPPPNQAPTAAFTSECDDLDCKFEDESSDRDGRIEDHDWTFGDGETSDDDDPDHRYSSGGTYQVTLTVRDNDGATASVTHAVTVTAPPPPPLNQPPTVGFTWQCNELDCEFEDQSSDSDGFIADHDWTFGDGETSDDENPDHSYSAGGTYQVTLTVTDDDEAESSVTHSVTVTAPPPPNQGPTAAFTESCTDLACSFNSGGSSDPDGTIVSWSWDFGDGSTSADANPNYAYAAGGTYTVTLRVEDDDDATDDETHSVTVTAAPPPNQPPVANADAYSTPGGGAALSVATPGVLGNDSDDGPTLSAQNASAPAQGSVSLSSDGSFTYTPNADATGSDSFTYEASDGSLTSQATVTITLTP